MAISQDLYGQNAIVTGGASGLGHAIADRLAASGASVTLVDLEVARTTAPKEYGFFACDLSRSDAKERLLALADELGSVDLLIANAGAVPPWRGLREVDGDEWM